MGISPNQIPAPPRPAPPRPAPLPRTILAILTASPFSLLPCEIVEKINAGRGEFGERPVSGDTVRSVLRRLIPKVESIGGGKWRVGAGHPLEKELSRKQGVPLPPPSVTHCGRLSLVTPCSPGGLSTIHDVLDRRFLGAFCIPRIIPPGEGDRAKQHIFEGVECKVIICEGNGKTTIYPKTPRWRIEFKDFFPPEQYQEAEGKKPSYSHEEYPKKQLERYLYSGGELTLETEGSQFPEGDFSIQGNHEDIQTAKASLSLRSRSEEIAIGFQVREETRQLRAMVKGMSDQIASLQEANSILLQSLGPKMANSEGGMFG